MKKDDKENKKIETIKSIPIDVDNDGIIDGFYTPIDVPKLQVLKKEIKDLKEGMNIPKSIRLKVPQTANISIEYVMDEKRKITVGASKELKPKENIEDAHKELYMQVLNSLDKLIR